MCSPFPFRLWCAAIISLSLSPSPPRSANEIHSLEPINKGEGERNETTASVKIKPEVGGGGQRVEIVFQCRIFVLTFQKDHSYLYLIL